MVLMVFLDCICSLVLDEKLKSSVKVNYYSKGNLRNIINLFPVSSFFPCCKYRQVKRKQHVTDVMYMLSDLCLPLFWQLKNVSLKKYPHFRWKLTI
jgi:hypothetical protein